MVPWSQSKSMQDQGSTATPPASQQTAPAPSAMPVDLPAHGLLLKHPFGFFRNRGCCWGHGGPTCSGHNKQERTRI